MLIKVLLIQIAQFHSQDSLLSHYNGELPVRLPLIKKNLQRLSETSYGPIGEVSFVDVYRAIAASPRCLLCSFMPKLVPTIQMEAEG